MINTQLYSRLKNIQWLNFFNVSCNLFHREALCVGRMNICIATPILVYGTKRFLSCDDLVIAAGGGISSVGTSIWSGAAK